MVPAGSCFEAPFSLFLGFVATNCSSICPFLSRRCSLCSSDSLLRLIRFLAVLHLCLQLLDTRERFLSGIFVNMTEVK